MSVNISFSICYCKYFSVSINFYSILHLHIYLYFCLRFIFNPLHPPRRLHQTTLWLVSTYPDRTTVSETFEIVLQNPQSSPNSQYLLCCSHQKFSASECKQFWPFPDCGGIVKQPDLTSQVVNLIVFLVLK